MTIIKMYFCVTEGPPMENLIFGAFATLDGYREGDAANLGRTVYDLSLIHI